MLGIANALQNRCMTSFQEHFELKGLISAAITSSTHGLMKPHPSIFEAAMAQAGVTAAESMMVGDSISHDIEGARRTGMRGVLVHRSGSPAPVDAGVPVIASLDQLVKLLA